MRRRSWRQARAAFSDRLLRHSSRHVEHGPAAGLEKKCAGRGNNPTASALFKARPYFTQPTAASNNAQPLVLSWLGTPPVGNRPTRRAGAAPETIAAPAV